jgi:type IV fimbrial biogenesis protein FimT
MRQIKCKRIQGFTLLELMTALAVLAILAGVGIPAFRDIVRNNQIAAESGDMVTALTLARSEALKRGMRVSVCGADGDECSDEADWSGGWIVFTDDFGDMGVIDEQDEVLQVWPAPLSGVVVGTADTQSVTFDRTARAEFEEGFTVRKEGCGKEQLRTIEVKLSGRVSLTRSDCPEG